MTHEVWLKLEDSQAKIPQTKIEITVYTLCLFLINCGSINAFGLIDLGVQAVWIWERIINKTVCSNHSHVPEQESGIERGIKIR